MGDKHIERLQLAHFVCAKEHCFNITFQKKTSDWKNIRILYVVFLYSDNTVVH